MFVSSLVRSLGWRLWPALLAAALLSLAAWADPYPPLWNNGSGAAVHYLPQGWPANNDWSPTTIGQQSINDPAIWDPSNGGTSPQNYVNISSSCIDKTAPSLYWYFRSSTIFFHWRTQQRGNTDAAGPSAGSYSSSDPWNSAQWTVLIDIDGDSWRESAVTLTGYNYLYLPLIGH